MGPLSPVWKSLGEVGLARHPFIEVRAQLCLRARRKMTQILPLKSLAYCARALPCGLAAFQRLEISIASAVSSRVVLAQPRRIILAHLPRWQSIDICPVLGFIRDYGRIARIGPASSHLLHGLPGPVGVAS